MRRGTLPRSVLFGLLVFAAGTAIPCPARAAPVELNIPAQPADTALLQLAKAANIELIFAFDPLHAVRSTAVAGLYEPEAALDLLLTGTGFAGGPNGTGKFVVRALPPGGSVKGRLLTPEGDGAVGVQVAIRSARRVTLTNDNGEFAFGSLPPGTYRLTAIGQGYQPLQIDGVRVKNGRVLNLAAETLQPANSLVRLDPVVVQGRSSDTSAMDRNRTSEAPPLAAGDLDLVRTQNDALPFEIFSRDQIVRSGVVNLDEFLQQEILESSATSAQIEPGMQGALFAGSTNLNMRSYGLDETVVLVNGRRLPDVLIGATTLQTAPDVNLIPLSLVQQVEVLPVSASAIYGGNPVGGVINIRLRSDADTNSTEVTTTYTNALRGFDAPESNVSLLHSQTLLGGALRLRVDGSFTQNNPPTESEVLYHETHPSQPPSLNSAVYGATPNIQSTPDASGNQAGLFGPGTPTVTSVPLSADGSEGLTAFMNRQGVRDLDLFRVPGGLSTSPDSLEYGYGLRQTRSVYYGSFDYDASPWLQVGFDGTYARTITHPGYDLLNADLTLSANSPFNPFNQPVNVSLNETAPLLGEGYNEAQVESATGVLGILFSLPSGWQATLDSQLAHNIARYRGLAGTDPNRWQQLVDEGLYNPLRDTQLYAPPSAFYNSVLIYEGGRGQFATLGSYDALNSAVRVTSASLALPTGTGTLNLGGDYQRDRFDNYNYDWFYADGSPAPSPAPWIGRTLQEYSAFGELQAPLLPSKWLPHWIVQTQADPALRYDASADAKQSSFAPTLGLKFDFAGGFSFRGSVTTSSRLPTPTLSRQAAGGAPVTGPNLQEIYDPLLNENYSVQVNEVPNPDLLPDRAVTETAGAILQRGSAVQSLRLSIDLTDTHKTDEQAFLDQDAVINLESLFPDLVRRAAPPPGSTGPGPIASLTTTTVNISGRQSLDWIATADWAWKKCAGGTLEIYARAVYFESYERQILPGSPEVDELKHPDGTTTDLLRLRANFGASWSDRIRGLGMDAHYYSSQVLPISEWPDQGSDRIKAFWQLDAYLRQELGQWLPWDSSKRSLRAQARVDNIFGFNYPKYADQVTEAGIQPYGDWRGRTYSLSLTATY
jgi:outer membrane receptor protein involved in Fe transport